MCSGCLCGCVSWLHSVCFSSSPGCALTHATTVNSTCEHRTDLQGVLALLLLLLLLLQTLTSRVCVPCLRPPTRALCACRRNPGCSSHLGICAELLPRLLLLLQLLLLFLAANLHESLLCTWLTCYVHPTLAVAAAAMYDSCRPAQVAAAGDAGDHL